MFTREEIINELEKKGIKISKRTFDYYREMNLIPPPEKRKNRAGLYSEKVISLIKNIRTMQNHGDSLPQIKKFFETARKKTQESTIKAKQERVVMICKGLGLKEDATKENVFLKKYGEFVKQLAIKKLKEEQEILESEDILNALILKKKQ